MEKKVALVTGSSRGIGKAAIEKFAEQGYDVVITYNGNKEKADQLASDMQTQYNVETLVCKLNIANAEEVNCVFDEIKEKFGRLDVLVNNGGITRDMLSMKMTEEDFNAVVNTNLTGSFLCSQRALKMMARQKSGAIVNVSSVIGVFGNAGQVNYAASKAGLIAMGKSYAKEYGKRGIRVNAVAPGFIETDMTNDLPDSLKEGVKTNVALARFGSSKEVANVIYFLGSEESSYISGQTILVDGGM